MNNTERILELIDSFVSYNAIDENPIYHLGMISAYENTLHILISLEMNEPFYPAISERIKQLNEIRNRLFRLINEK